MGSNLDQLWEVFTKFLWPVMLGYAAYMHRRLDNQGARLAALQHEFYERKAEVNKTFATHDAVTQLENKVVSMLNRIDDKVTRILEDKN